MSYDSVERSQHGGSPIELYQFTKGADAYRFTSADEDVSINFPPLVTFSKAVIKRNAFEQKSDMGKASLRIEVPHDNAVARLFRIFVPSETIILDLFRKHRSDSEVITYWKGFVRSVSWAGPMAAMECDPISVLLETVGVRFQYQSICNHMLFSTPCGVAMAAYSHAGIISGIAGNVITSAAIGAQAAGYFDGGQVVLASGDRRMITATSGNDATILLPFEELAVGQAITAIAGCDRNHGTCDSKFSNLANFGGFPSIPFKNPFSVGLEG